MFNLEVEEPTEAVANGASNITRKSTMDQRKSRKSMSEDAAHAFMGANEESNGISEAEVIMSLITAIIGAGVVALPGLMKLSGWFLGPLLCIFTGVCFLDVGCFLHDAISHADSTVAPSEAMRSFDDFGYAAYGQIGVTMVKATVSSMFFGYLVCFQVLIGKNIRLLLPMENCDKPQVKWCIAAATPALLGLAMLQDMQKLAKLMPVGAFVALGGCAVITYKGLADAQMRTDGWRGEETWTDEHSLYTFWPESLSTLGTVIAVLFAAFAVMGTVPTIRGQMKEKECFPDAFRKAILIVLVLYTACMLSGYYGYGNFIQDSVVDSMRRYPADLKEARNAVRHDESDFNGEESIFFGNLMALMVTVNLLVSWPVYFQCVIGSLERFYPDAAYAQYGNPANYAFRVMLVFIACGIAMVVPYFRSVMAILASVCCSCNNVLWPLLFSYQFIGGKLSATRKAFHVLIVGFAFVCAILGLIDSVSGLIKKLTNQPAANDCFVGNTTLIES